MPAPLLKYFVNYQVSIKAHWAKQLSLGVILRVNWAKSASLWIE
jgi:hypothetical protein